MSRGGRKGPHLTLLLLAVVAGGFAGRAWWPRPAAPAHRTPTQAQAVPSHALPDPIDRRPPIPTEATAPASAEGRSEEPGSEESDPTGSATNLASTLAELDGAGRAELITRTVWSDAFPEVIEVAATQLVQEALGGSERPMSAEERHSCCDALLRTLAPRLPLTARRTIVVSILAAGSLPQVEALLAYLERQEPDAGIQGWGTGAARSIRDAGGVRDHELLASLIRRLEPGSR